MSGSIQSHKKSCMSSTAVCAKALQLYGVIAVREEKKAADARSCNNSGTADTAAGSSTSTNVPAHPPPPHQYDSLLARNRLKISHYDVII